MAVSKIQYQNKTAIQNDEDIPRPNKVTDEDMNEIKNVVNNNADELNTTKENVENLQEGQGTANTDITNLKSRVSTLETDNTKNKSDIENLQNDNETNQSNIGGLQQKTEQIEENVLDIQQGQETQNTEIANLQTEVQELNEDIKANAIIEETEKSKSLYMDDANASRGKVNVFGNMEQEIREGYNLIDILNSTLINTNKSVEIEIDKDGYVIANGTPTADYIVFIRKSIDNLLEDKQTYSVWQEKYSQTTDGEIYSQVLATPKEGSSGSQQYINSSTKKATFVVDKNKYTYNWTLQIGLRSVAGTFNNYKNRYMLYKGTDNKEFELYGASPSLNYPSSIKCLGDNKQLFDGIFRQGNEVLTSSSTNVFSSNNISCNKDKDYTISTNLDLTVYRYALFTNTNSFPTNNPVTDSTGYKTESQTTIKSTVDGYIGILIGKKDNSAISPEDINKYYFKLEAGKIATSYSPMGQGSTKIKKTNRNYLDSFNYYTANTSKTINGITFKINPDGTITANGTATANAFFDFSYTHVIGTNKIMVLNNISGSSTGGIVRFITYNSDFSAVQNITMDGRDVQAVNLNADIEYSIFRYAVYQNAVCNNLTLGFMVLDKTETDRTYTQHQEENCILNIQQEMLTGDYFDLDRKKEIHNWGKIVLTGGEAITKYSDFHYFLTKSDAYKANISRSDSIASTHFEADTANNFWNSAYDKDNYIVLTPFQQIGFVIKSYATIDEFKSALAEKYTNGKPVIVYYKLETPIELDLTDTQIQQLEKLNKLRFYEGVNNIMTLEDIALIQAEYSVNLKDVNNKMRQEIDEIKELLSTTQTSAMLLDNLEEDLIEEVK